MTAFTSTITSRDPYLLLPGLAVLALAASGAPPELRFVAALGFVLVTPGRAVLRLARLRFEPAVDWTVTALFGWAITTLLSLAGAYAHAWFPWLVFGIEYLLALLAWLFTGSRKKETA
jgi:hypothetical protein